MKVIQFFDRQHKNNPLNGSQLTSESVIHDELERLGKGDPCFCELIHQNGHSLLIGIASEVACVQFSRTDGSLPYLMAVNDDPIQEADLVDFAMNDTPSPVPIQFCVAVAIAKSIATEFVRTGLRSRIVNWREV